MKNGYPVQNRIPVCCFLILPCRGAFAEKSLAEPVDDVARADLRTVAALDTLRGIDLGEKIDHGDGVRRALALALHAADAAEVAHLHNLCALIMVAAGRHDLLALGNELDDALGAGVGACAAANTAGTGDLSDAIDNVYRVELAGAGAVAETDACESQVRTVRPLRGYLPASHHQLLR